MFSIYCSIFNLESLKFDWKESIENWLKFLNGMGEIILVLNKSNDNSDKILNDYISKLKIQYILSTTKINIIKTEFDYNNPLFDGMIKNAGYKACKQPITISLDLDEVVCIDSIRSWISTAKNLLDSEFDAYIIPSINLCKTWKEYKDIGSKFYMVKNKSNIMRGVVNYAKNEDGSIDISKSDTCEVIFENDSSLVKCTHLIPPNLPDFMKLAIIKNGSIFVYHLGWLNLEHRLKINEFWKPIWEARAKREVGDIVTDKNELDKIKTISHDLQYWDSRL